MAKTFRRTGAAVLASAAGSAMLLTGCSTESDAEPTSRGAAMRSVTADPVGAASSPGIVVSRDADREITEGPADNFTGTVSIQPQYSGDDNAERISDVRFEAGARTAWHTHPAGQRLIVTDGTGWVQEWGKKRITVHEGDIVWFAPGVKHWHGATAGSAMAHLAVTYAVDGATADWMEHVNDDQYLGRKKGDQA
ncbi:(R)-mandelonitrile lyase [Streptomyces ardesiacus]